ncbi:precorrin-6Y C5,15-methyltransferase (decarboxylating) [Rhodopseudomonas palustris HaA2]|uniref:Precorrin-6Y C5,15-methyltransferase (Decarboxylating) n=1 Tax=Rhodopseudomonas palustris (strain HaA2) TaxID=316058 RepID=Q2IV82_RHOP2|nr:bifunctional cobalt-precorrin-7 (C(5))-methyltransferase/cobalt-precorrin-6B (C(15))-methyltransferase [Rhodopseudomonas palustris]ABD07878.1 precorrin-6Y C5,15-methyltransferase (decarboxylating) [Rhodopseudomonas palustris HaA2]
MTATDDTPTPWLSIVGIGEDGVAGLSDKARALLANADLVIGGERHLAMVAALGRPTLPWRVPFAVSLPDVLAQRGRSVVVLCSGDPFWHGAGAVLADHLAPSEWTALPAPSTFSWAAARLGWRLEETITLGLHARPITMLRPHLQPGSRLIVLVRDGAAVAQIAAYLTATGFGPSSLTVLEALGGPRERILRAAAANYTLTDVAAPVAIGIDVVAQPDSAIIPHASGLPDELFQTDGQLTKRAIRAVTLSSLAPRGGELLWDIGAGSGSIGIEWLLAARSNRAIGIEARPDRLACARGNADALGVPHFDLRLGQAPEALADLPTPDAVFIGGGAGNPGVLDAVWQALPPGGRLVVNAVTLETEALLIACHGRHGGELLRLGVERAAPVGGLTAWRAAIPVVQWSVRK